jgi:hypothetical protein
MSEFIKKVSVVLSLVFLSACSSSGTFTVKQALVEPIKNDRSVSILVKTDLKESDEDSVKAVSGLREKLFATLVSEGVFKSSVLAPNKADYSLEVDIKGVSFVSTAARLAFGVMAGSSTIEAEVLLKEMTTNKVVTEFRADGSSASHPLSSETGPENAVREAAKNIVAALKK